MAKFDKKLMASKGGINVIKLGEPNQYLLLLLAANTTTKDYEHYEAVMIGDSRGFNTYIDIEDLDISFAIEDLMKTLHKDFRGLPNFSHCLTIKAPAHSMVADSFVLSNVGNNAPTEKIQKILTDLGYDASALSHSFASVKSEKLDYSTLVDADEEAKRNVEENKAKLALMGASITTCATPGAQFLYQAMLNGKIKGVLFTGPAGTGKSILARIMAVGMGAPLLSYQGNEGAQIEDFTGAWIPDVNKPGSYVFCPGILLKAYTQGWQMLIDEINMAPASILSILNQFLDDTPFIIASDGVTYRKHQNFVLYATMNPGYEGTSALNPALKSRMTVLPVDRLTRQTYVERMINYSANICGNALSKAFFEKLYSFMTDIMDQSNKLGENVEICIRNSQSLCNLILTKPCSKQEFVDALTMSFLGYLSIDNDNYEAVQSLKEEEANKKKIDDLYSLYDFKTATVAEPDYAFADVLSVSASSSGSSSFDPEDEDFSELDAELGISDADMEEETDRKLKTSAESEAEAEEEYSDDGE